MSFSNKKNNNLRRRNVPLKDKGVPTYAYSNSRNETEESRGRDTKRKQQNFINLEFWLSRFGFVTLLIVSIVCLVSVLDLSSKPKIVVDGDANGRSLYNRYRLNFVTASSRLFSSSLLNHNKITVNTKSITDTLRTKFPEFSSINIALPLINHNPIIYVTPSVPVILLTNSQGEYLLNQSGIAIVHSASGLNTLDLPIVDDQSGFLITTGQPALPSSDISFIQIINSQLNAKHYTISLMTLPKNTSELDVGLVGQAYIVKFNLSDTNVKQQIGSFLATANYLNNQKITPSKYIDVRSEGRVYYQ